MSARGGSGHLLVFALVLMGLSGCAGTEDASMADAPGARFSEDTGGIDGLVTDDQLLPVAGANASLPALNVTVTTDVDGRFAFSDVPPGEVEVRVEHVAFETWTEIVEVKAGEALVLEVEMRPVASLRPTKTTLFQQGLFGCGTSWRPPLPNASGVGGYTGLSACGLVNDANGVGGINTTSYDQFLLVWKANLSKGSWDGAVLEMEWTSTQAFGKGMTMVWEVYPCYNVRDPKDTKKFPLRFASVQGRSPLRVEIDRAKIEGITKNTTVWDSYSTAANGCGEEPVPKCDEKECVIVSRVFSSPDTMGSGSSVDVGITTQQPFRQALTLFFNQPVTEEYSAFRT